MSSAYSLKNMDCILTRNLKDFEFSEIKVFTPDEFVQKIRKISQKLLF